MQGTALITGGSLRLGHYIALHLAHKGKKIALHYNSSKNEALATCRLINQIGTECRLFQSNFNSALNSASRQNNPDQLIEQVVSQCHDLDLLINNASVYEQAPLLETTGAQWERIMNVNFRTPIFLMRSFALATEKRENRQIINILDNKIAFHQYHYFAYLLSKKGLATATQLAAAELAPAIRVNGIAPGVILPASSRSSEYLNWRLEGIPLGKKGEVESILNALDYLLQGDFVTGQILTVDGGEMVASVGRNAANWPLAGANEEANAETNNAEANMEDRKAVESARPSSPHSSLPSSLHNSPPSSSHSSSSSSPHSSPHNSLHSYVVAVGSNIEPHKNVALAMEILQKEQRLIGKSTFIRTKPVGLQEQPDFLNGAVYIQSSLNFDKFRSYLKAVEKRLKRVKGPIKSSQRTIDLDIIIHNNKIVEKEFYRAHYIREPVCEVIEQYEISL